MFNTFHPFNFVFYSTPTPYFILPSSFTSLPSSYPHSVSIPYPPVSLLHISYIPSPPSPLLQTLPCPRPLLSLWHVQMPNQHERKICKNKSKINSSPRNVWVSSNGSFLLIVCCIKEQNKLFRIIISYCELKL